MNSTVIAVLVAVALVVLILILKKSSAKKAPPAEAPEAETPPEVGEAPGAAGEEQEAEPEAVAPEPAEAAVEEVAAEPVPEKEEEAAPEVEAVVEKEEPPAAEEETVVEPEPEEEEKPAEAVVEEVEAEPVAAEEEAAIAEAEEEPEVPAEPVAELPQVTVTLEQYEQRLFRLKDDRLASLTEAIDNNEETRREQLQAELVAITEALSFLPQGYAQDTDCRRNALAALEDMKAELDSGDYDRAVDALCEGDTGEAEEVFVAVAESDSPLAAPAFFQSGCLAERRMDLNKAMALLEKAVNLQGENPEFLRAAALLARRLYQHKKALGWFDALVRILEKEDEDSVDLALARRDLAYTSALVGQHKQAGGLYKQAMVSLTKLVGKDDPEMGICWFQIGKLQEALGNYEKADEPYNKALAILEKDEDSQVLGEILEKTAGLYMELEREPEAIPLLERLCAFKEKSANPDKASLAMTYTNLAEAYRICGKYEQSEENYKQALAITEELRGKDHAAVGSILQELAQLCQRQGKTDEAKEHQERAAAIFQRVLEEQEAKGQESASLTL